jgi:hypothetical protein
MNWACMLGEWRRESVSQRQSRHLYASFSSSACERSLLSPDEANRCPLQVFNGNSRRRFEPRGDFLNMFACPRYTMVSSDFVQNRSGIHSITQQRPDVTRACSRLTRINALRTPSNTHTHTHTHTHTRARTHRSAVMSTNDVARFAVVLQSRCFPVFFPS